MSDPIETRTIASPTGARLNARVALVDEPRALVAIQHGMAEHGGRYARFQRALAARGYASVAHDHRGHGLTDAPDAARGFFAPADGWANVLRDAMAAREALSAEHPTVPVVAFGHSMGGLVALDLALTHPSAWDALAVWNIGVVEGLEGAALRAALRVERFRLGSDVPSPAMRRLTFDAYNKRFAPNRTAFDWLSRDRREVDAYVADPLAGHEITVGMWSDVADAMRRLGDDGRLAALPASLPVHLLGGADDPVTKGGAGVRRIAERLRRAGLRDVTDTVLPNTRHESLNDANRGTTTNAFIDWLNARFGR